MNSMTHLFKTHHSYLLKLATGVLFLLSVSALYSVYYYKHKYDTLVNQQDLIVNFKPTYLMYLQGAESWAKQEAYCSSTIKDLNDRVHECIKVTAPMVAAMTDYTKKLKIKADALKKRCGEQCGDIN